MEFKILHETRNRMRVHLMQYNMSFEQADTLLFYLQAQSFIKNAKVYQRNGNVAIEYIGNREKMIELLQRFQYETVVVPEDVFDSSGRKLNAEYQEKIVDHILYHYTKKIFFPTPLKWISTLYSASKFILKGLKCLYNRKIEVPVLDATAISISILRSDISTASSIMFMLGIGEILEEWTHKKSVSDLARVMALNVNQVWVQDENGKRQVSTSQVKEKDEVIVYVGNIIPFDGIVLAGEAMVNQASMTGESVPVRKIEGSSVYAGTTLEEGEITFKVTSKNGNSRYEKIVTMIEETEKLKSGVESKAEHLADHLVPYSLGGTLLTYLLTRNATKALSVLMVDYSCALKLAMPVSVLSAIREASSYSITVKGGKFLEAMADADTIVFDKTGTLTKAKPSVADVISFNDTNSDELLRIAACLEEHFPHSMARAVVNEATKRNLEHEEMHSKVEYIVAHGITSSIENKRVIIGSYHFVFEDEKCKIPFGKEELFYSLPSSYSHLYLAIDNELAAVILIEDPLRKEAKDVIETLKGLGLKVVMMTGDSDRTAKAIAQALDLDEYYSEVLPEDKASFILKEKEKGRKVIMIGDGINDSPALSQSDVGIAISDGAELAREIADVTIAADNLNEIVVLKQLSDSLMRRIHKNYREIISFNSALIALGVMGVIQPTTSSLLHNMSTLLIGMSGTTNLLDN